MLSLSVCSVYLNTELERYSTFRVFVQRDNNRCSTPWVSILERQSGLTKFCVSSPERQNTYRYSQQRQVCTNNINKLLCFYKIKKTNMMHFLPSRLEQERFKKMNRNSANTCLTDMINISIESFKLLLNEIKQIENKNFHYYHNPKRCFSL